MARASDDTHIRILVAEDRVFQRRLIVETLRSLGRVQVDHVETVAHALAVIPHVQPALLIADWDFDGGRGLALIQAVRGGEASEAFRALPLIMTAARGRSSEIELARNCGIDEFVLRPFSTATLLQRVHEVQARRREFIESVRYVGPCRRRRRGGSEYDGPRRRLFDSGDANADSPDTQIRKGLARMYAERISTQLADLTAPDAMRTLCLTCGQLDALADDMRDKLLMSAASSLFNYVKGVGMEAALNRDVVRASGRHRATGRTAEPPRRTAPDRHPAAGRDGDQEAAPGRPGGLSAASTSAAIAAHTAHAICGARNQQIGRDWLEFFARKPRLSPDKV